MNPIRRAIRNQVHAVMHRGPSGRSQTPVEGDGLFGAASAVRAVHGDFPAMMIGGVSSLFLQMLHPAALAGIWDHSRFRDDMHGRLRRTAGFIGVTTHGSTEAADAAIARVRQIHDRVTGMLPDGTPYAANDPALLTWVHVTETSSFLAAYLRYRDPIFSTARQDAYHAEMAMLARRLGAPDVPSSRRQAAAYLQDMRATLRCDERTSDVARTICDHPAGSTTAAPLQRVMIHAGMELLPDWARTMHGFALSPRRRLAIRTGGVGAGHVLRWALA